MILKLGGLERMTELVLVLCGGDAQGCLHSRCRLN